MRNKFAVVAAASGSSHVWLMLVFGALLSATMVLATNAEPAFAQTDTNENLTIANFADGDGDNDTNLGTVKDNFLMQGAISSWVFDNRSSVDDGKSKTILISENPYILSGVWALRVHNGSATYFKADFTMVRTNGTDFHMHRFINFMPSNTNFTVTVLLQPGSNSTVNNNINSVSVLKAVSKSVISIPGTVDITTNNTVKWSNVPITLIIRGLHAMNIEIDTGSTDNHFTTQPMYGVVNSITYY